MTSLKIVFGSAPLGHQGNYRSLEYIEKTFEVLEKYGVKNIDTAQLYGLSEETLGKLKAGSRFTIDTKEFGGWKPGGANKQGIVDRAKESITKKIAVEKVDIFYIHAPDKNTPLSSTLAGIDEVHKAGLFERFGLSNFNNEEVIAVHEHCKEHGFVLPSVFQGNYSAVARTYETSLFPTLRKYGMSFYAYSPLAGGFLARSKEQILAGEGRFDPKSPSSFHKKMYEKPTLLEALGEWEHIAESEGCSRIELAYRWVAYNSPLKPEFGDAMIVGASRIEQLEQTLTGLKAGPLKEESVQRIEALWKKIEHEAPVDNFNVAMGYT